jgi:hypothetical protein
MFLYNLDIKLSNYKFENHLKKQIFKHQISPECLVLQRPKFVDL